MSKTRGLVLFFFLASPAASALAQDFGIEWIDRVTHEMERERGPLQASALSWTASAGAAYAYDNNVFLTESNRQHDSVVIPFVRGRLDYAEPHFDASADLLFDYKIYSRLKDSRDDEERFYGRAQYADAAWMAGLSVLVRHESDPVDVVFLDRAAREVVDLVPRVSVDIASNWAVEAGADLQIVHFEDDALANASDNRNYRADVSLIYRMPLGLSAIAQGGYLAIDYTNHKDAAGNPTAPPDVDGFFLRGGIRGDLLEKLWIEALVGYAKAESDDYKGATLNAPGKNLSTSDILLRAKFEATSLVTLWGDYSRQMAFAGGQDPFEVVNRLLGIVEVKATDLVSLRGRVQFDRVDSALGVLRDFFSVSASGQVRPHEYLVVDGGVTWRWGKTSGAVAVDEKFSDTIVHVGVALTY
jgi:hypothetical protein